MDYLENIKLAFTALIANKTRSLLTILGMIIGVSSVILLISIGTGLQTYVTQQLEGLGADALFAVPGELEIGSGGGSGGTMGAGAAAPKFTFDHIKDIEREAKHVDKVMAYSENNSTLKYKSKTRVVQAAGVNQEFPEIRNQKVIRGSFFTASQYNSAKKVAVIGTTVASELFGNEDPIGKKFTVSEQRYTVLGVLEKKGAISGVDMDNQIFIPTTTAMQHFETEYVQSLWIKAKGTESIPEAKAEVERILLKTLKDDEFSILDTQSILSTVSNILGILTAALGGIAAISLIVGGIGIMNIMLVSVTERTKEIGLRKALGATPRVILTQFLIEAVVLSVFGGIIGISLGMLGSWGIGRFFTTTVTPWSVLLAFTVSALVGIIFGVAPAIRAARLNPITALRYE